MKKIIFTELQINDIIRLRQIEKWGINRIGKQFGVGYQPIARVLKSRGIPVTTIQEIIFSDAEKAAILDAYASGIGANGIKRHLGFKCSDTPIIRFLKSTGIEMRNRSKQQQARMNKASPEEIMKLTKAAHNASKGRKATAEERCKRAKTIAGVAHPRSRYEPIVYSVLSKYFDNIVPSMAIDRYNIDLGIGKVAVEVFGGNWSVSDSRRIARYIDRTKKLAEFGFHTVFIVLAKVDINSLNWNQLVKTVQIASSDPSPDRKYWVIWGDSQSASGFCSDINERAFICPFINVRDRATGRYVSVPR